jgi:hypothetical protein
MVCERIIQYFELDLTNSTQKTSSQNISHFKPVGNTQNLRPTPIYKNNQMPKGLPSVRPAIMPKLFGCNPASHWGNHFYVYELVSGTIV